MSMPNIRRDVSLMLDQANRQIADAEIKLSRGGDREKAHAIGELVFLKRQKETLEQRLKEIEDHPEANETMFQWIKEEWFNLTLRLEQWIANV